MPNTSRKNNLNQNINTYLNIRANWRSDKGDVSSLLKRLKESKQKENIQKLVFAVTAISILVISGIIISF